jgi:hypothetical protein
MFIVAITLGLLAAMGIYGLTATAYDVRASGHTRAAAQGQHAAEASVNLVAAVIGPGNVQSIMNQMGTDQSIRTNGTSCKTAKPLTSTGESTMNRTAESCLVWTLDSMKPYVSDQTAWVSTSGKVTAPYLADSFGEVVSYPHAKIEFTNPVSWDAPAGFTASSNSGGMTAHFQSIRTTVFVQMQTDKGVPADFVAAGRGRLLAGPTLN